MKSPGQPLIAEEAVSRLGGSQRVVVESLLEGLTRRQVSIRRQTTRQATFKVLQAALRTLAAELGPLPPRSALERLPDPTR